MIEIRNLTKRYPGVLALDGVSLRFEPGRVHALVGENGAGKSTLIKILAGVLTPDRGEIRFQDQPVHLPTPIHARRLGIAVVHQHSQLIPDLSIAENYALREGYPRRLLGQIAWHELNRRATQVLQLLIPSLDVRLEACGLSAVQRRLVELSFALAAKPRLLILDEPTAVLPQRETEQLFERLRTFVAEGGSVLFVSHRLEEVFAIAQEVAVLRDGRLVWQKPTSETDHDELIRAMVGRAVTFQRDPTCVPNEKVSLQVSNLTDTGGAFHDIHFHIRSGEIYGLYGLVGAGQSELCHALFGLRESRGEVRLGGRNLQDQSPQARVQAGLAYVPADRLTQGLLYQMSVGENLSLATLKQFTHWGWIDQEAERSANQQRIQELHIRTLGVEQGVAQLSGGNQQKTLLGRWLQTEPQVLILEEPTQGVDVGAKGEIHRLIIELAKRGVSILLISSEIPELLALSHRIGILREGELITEVQAARATEEEILRSALPERGGQEDKETRGQGDKETRGQGDNSTTHDSPPHHLTASLPLTHYSPLTKKREAVLALLMLAITVLFSFTLPGFGTRQNLLDILVNHSILLIGALGMTLVIISGGIDISVGAILGLAAVAAAKADQAGWSPWLIAFVALLAGTFLGTLNGLLSVFGRVHSIVITLGTLFIFRGAIIQITEGRWLLNLSERIRWFGQSEFAGLSILLLVALAMTLLVHLFLKYRVAGRRLYALGSDRAGAAFLGIYPHQGVPLAFGLSGFLMGLAGLLHAGKFGQVQTNVGQGFELEVIAAAVIGGTSIMGGRGSALGTLLGAIFIGLIRNLLIFTHVSAFWEGVMVGGMILLALIADALSSGKLKGLTK